MQWGVALPGENPMAQAVSSGTVGSAVASDASRLKRQGSQSRVGFLITEVEAEPSEKSHGGAAAPAVERQLPDTTAKLPPINVYRVEDAELPAEVVDDVARSAPLPATIPMEKVMTNIVNNLEYKGVAENARSLWFKDFKSPPSRAVINDTFWYCICFYFKCGRHPDVEDSLFDRISANFVGLFRSVATARKDFFFRFYADAVAQAVLYAMFLAYPKSRVRFTENFRKNLIKHLSCWSTGVCPEFVDCEHWHLNLGSSDVLLQSAISQPWMRTPGGDSSMDATVPAGGSQAWLRPPGETLGATRSAGKAKSQLSVDWLQGKRASIAHRAPRKMRFLRYSPLVEYFLKSRKYSSVNLIRPTVISMTTAEERSRLMDVRHEKLLEKANAARERCDNLASEYDELCLEVRHQERLRNKESANTKKRLEIRRKEVLRSDPHEYANYLVSLHLLQQGFGQGS